MCGGRARTGGGGKSLPRLGRNLNVTLWASAPPVDSVYPEVHLEVQERPWSPVIYWRALDGFTCTFNRKIISGF